MDQSRIKCPYCGELIASTARKCRFCGEWLSNPDVQPVEQSQPQPPQVQQPQVPQPQPQPQVQQPAYEPPVLKQPSAQKKSLNQSITDRPSFFNTYFVTPFIRQFKDFKDVTGRKTFWLSVLAVTIVSLGVSGISFLIIALSEMSLTGMTIAGVISAVWSLALIVPTLALSSRRLRDAGKSPMLNFLYLLPAVGPIILLILWCKESRCKHEDELAKFKPVDIAIASLSVVLLVGGIIMMWSKTADMMSGSSDYELNYDADLPDVESVTDVDFEDNSVSDYSASYSDGQTITEGYNDVIGADRLGFYGPLNGTDRIRINLNFAEGTGTFSNFTNGDRVDLFIESYNAHTEKIILNEFNGKESGRFEGRLHLDRGEFTGWYIAADGSKVPFSLTLDTDP